MATLKSARPPRQRAGHASCYALPCPQGSDAIDMPTQEPDAQFQESIDPLSAGATPVTASARSIFLKHLRAGWQLKACISLALIILLARDVDWAKLADSLAVTNKRYIAAAFALLSLAPIMTAERWRNAALASNVRLSRMLFLRATYAAVFVGQFLPAGVGVDVARLGILWKKKVPLRLAAQSIIVDRIIGVSSILILMLTGMPFAMHRLPPSAVLPTVLVIGLLVAAFASLLFMDRLPLPQWLRRRQIESLFSLLSPARDAMRTPQVALAFGYGIGLHAACILAVLFLAQAFGYSLQYRDLLTVVSFTIFAALLPISFNGWGVREGSMIIALSLLSVSKEAALVISFLFGIGSAISSLPGSVSWHSLDAGNEDESGNAR